MTLAKFATPVLVAGALLLAACGGSVAEEERSAAAAADRETEVTDAARQEQAAERAEAKAQAAAERKAKRDAAAAKVARVEARDRRRGDALLKVFIAAGTRDAWSVMSVSADGGAVRVFTDLPPGSGDAFSRACTQLVGAEPWIASIDVSGTDGSSHATWAKGDAACSTPGG